MALGGNALSRNPNICASCSSVLDGMDESEHLEAEKVVEEELPSPAETPTQTPKAA